MFGLIFLYRNGTSSTWW